MKLFNHQQRFLEKNQRVALLVHSMGSGKTRTACEWAKLRLPQPVLIICPKGLKENWRRECEKWEMDMKKVHIISKEEFKKNYQLLPFNVLIIDEADYF